MRKWLYSFLCSLSCVLHAVPTKTVEEVPVVIIGSGVAALTAATYLGRAGLSPIVIEGETMGGAITQSQRIQNWPGELEISGLVLAEQLYSQAQQNGAQFFKEKIVAVDFSKRPFLITMQPLLGNETRSIRAKTCIIALGSTPNLLNIPGEHKYWSSGVYSCAVCDGSLYRNQVVAVVGGGDSALVDAEYLSSLASHVFLLVRKDHLKATELKRVEHIAAHPKVTILYNTVVKEVLGNETLATGLKIENTQTKKESILPVNALFIKIGSTPNTSLFQKQLSLDSQGYVVLKRGQETSVPGVFAAGDIADPEFQQAICAAGDGAKAALQAQRMLGSQEKSFPVATAHISEVKEEIIEVATKKELAGLMENRMTELTFIDFYSTRCSPCKLFASHYETWAHDFHGRIRFAKVNADTGRELFHAYGIQGVPSLVILDAEGKVLLKKVGLQEIAEVGQKLKMCQTGEPVDPLLFKSVR